MAALGQQDQSGTTKPMRTYSTILRLIVGGKILRWALLILIFMGPNGLEVAAQSLTDYKHALVDYYGAAGFHPLLVPQEHQVGDVINILTKQVVWEQERCFPGLQTGLSTESNLPDVKLLENQTGTLWASLRYFLNLAVDGNDRRQIRLNLQDVSVEFVSLGALQDALEDVHDEACSALLPLFENNRMPMINRRRVNVIAAIMKARVNTIFSYSGSVQAEATLERLAAWLGVASEQLRKLAPELTLTFGLADTFSVIHEADNVQTVAYQPAVIFRPRLGGETEDQIEVEPFDPDSEHHQELLRNWSRAWADMPEMGE